MLDIQIKKIFYSKNDDSILENIAIHISKPGIYGIVGKNGVGKTTFFKSLLKQVKFEGSITLDNKDLVRGDILWCPTEPVLYNELTGKEFINFFSQLTLGENSNKENYFFKLPENEFIANYSTGMRKKIYLNALFIREYDLYILDEPFNGLDIESNLKVIKYLKQVAETKIVFISSHVLESLFSFCNEIYVVNDKKLKRFEKEDFTEIERYFLN